MQIMGQNLKQVNNPGLFTATPTQIYRLILLINPEDDRRPVDAHIAVNQLPHSTVDLQQ